MIEPRSQLRPVGLRSPPHDPVHLQFAKLLPEPFRLVLFLVGIMAFVGLNAAYLVWVERKGAARFQRRPGPTEVGLRRFAAAHRRRRSS